MKSIYLWFKKQKLPLLRPLRTLILKEELNSLHSLFLQISSITADLHHSCILNILWLQLLWFFTRVAWGRSPPAQIYYIYNCANHYPTTLLVCLLFFIFCHLIFFYYAVWSRFLFFASKKNLWVHINIIGIVFYLLSYTFLSSFVIIVSFHFSFVVLLLLSGGFFFSFSSNLSDSISLFLLFSL